MALSSEVIGGRVVVTIDGEAYEYGLPVGVRSVAELDAAAVRAWRDACKLEAAALHALRKARGEV